MMVVKTLPYTHGSTMCHTYHTGSKKFVLHSLGHHKKAEVWFASGDFWVFSRSQITHFQAFMVLQDDGYVNVPILGYCIERCQNPYPGDSSLSIS